LPGAWLLSNSLVPSFLVFIATLPVQLRSVLRALEVSLASPTLPTISPQILSFLNCCRFCLIHAQLSCPPANCTLVLVFCRVPHRRRDCRFPRSLPMVLFFSPNFFARSTAQLGPFYLTGAPYPPLSATSVAHSKRDSPPVGVTSPTGSRSPAVETGSFRLSPKPARTVGLRQAFMAPPPFASH